MADHIAECLNESFLMTALQQNNRHHGQEVKLKHFTTEEATTSGDNYLSTVLRVTVEYSCCVVERNAVGEVRKETTETEVKLQLILKIPHNGDWVKTLIGDCYKSENTVYTELLPKIYDRLRTERYFTPRLLCANSRHCMAFEDLSAEGYVVPDKLKQLDFDHCLMCVKTLAKFHAGSVAVVKKCPEVLDTVGTEPFYTLEKREINKQNLASMSDRFVKAVASWNLFENFEERTRRIWPEIVDSLIEAHQPRKTSLNVINHGDVWSNNVMFRYDSTGRPVDMKLIDFQTCRYTSPVIDLHCLVFTSAEEDVVERHLPELTNAYLEALNGQLEELGCEERLTKRELDSEFNASLHVGFAVIYEFLPLFYPNEDTVLEFPESDTDEFSNSDIYGQGYNGKNYVPLAIRGLRFLEKHGFF